MTERINPMSTVVVPQTTEKISKSIEVGDILTAEVIDKNHDETTVMLDERLIKMAGDVEIVEEVGEKIRLEVANLENERIELRYIKPNRLAENSRSIIGEVKKSLQIDKVYDQGMVKAIEGLTAKEVEAINEKVVTFQKDLTTLVNTMSDEDVKALFEMDLNPKKMAIDTMTTIVKNNKQAIKERDIDTILVKSSKVYDSLKNRYESEERLEQIVMELKKQEIPQTLKNVDKVIDGLKKLDEIAVKLERKELRDLYNILKLEGDVTLKQLYASSKTQIQQPKPMSMNDEELGKMVLEHMKKIGVKIPEGMNEEDVVTTAVELVKRDIPVTKENMVIALEPEKYIDMVKAEPLYIQKMVKQLVDEKPVEDIVVKESSRNEAEPITSPKTVEKAKKAIASMYSIETTQITRAVISSQRVYSNQGVSYNQSIQVSQRTIRTEQYLNIETITGMEKGPLTNSEKEAITGWNNKQQDKLMTNSLVKAHRQIEEIRLKMTFEAAIRLESKGLHIETAELEKVVEELRVIETQTIESFVDGQIRGKSVALSKMDEAMVKAEQATQYTDNSVSMPEDDLLEAQLVRKQAVYNATVKVISKEVIESMDSYQILKRSIPVSEDMTVRVMAEQAYAQGETEIRRDLGDRIEKTFDQIKPMLESMGIEPSKESVRAAEILGRNEMPITEEAILEIQAVQEKVSYVTERMNPKLALEMIRVGVTPLDLTLDETIELIDEYDRKFGETDGERISRLIYELEKNDQMTPEQKESLLGIYRTFDTVVRSKGAATGFLVKNQLSLNVEQLFEAAKFIRQNGQIKPTIVANIDDEFGQLTDVLREGKTIKEQTMTAIDSLGLNDSTKTVEIVEAFERSATTVTKTMVLSKSIMDITLKSFIRTLSSESLSSVIENKGMDKVRDMPLKTLDDMLKAIESGDEKSDSLRTLAEETMKFVKNNPLILKEMIQKDMPMSLETIERAMVMNKEPFQLLKRIREVIEHVDNEGDRQVVIDKVAVTSRDILSGEKSVEALKDTLAEVEKYLYEQSEAVDPKVGENTAEGQKIVHHIQMLQVTEDYYQIPIMMGNQLSQLNMYILNDQGESLGSDLDTMKVVMRFNTQSLGEVTAYIEIGNSAVNMNLQSEYMEDRSLLAAYEGEIKSLLEESDFGNATVSYERHNHRDPMNSTRGISDSNASGEETSDINRNDPSSQFEIVV